MKVTVTSQISGTRSIGAPRFDRDAGERSADKRAFTPGSAAERPGNRELALWGGRARLAARVCGSHAKTDGLIFDDAAHGIGSR